MNLLACFVTGLLSVASGPATRVSIPEDVTPYVAKLKGKGVAFVEEGDFLTVLREQKADRIRITGTLSGGMVRIPDTDTWIARFKIKKLPSAVITVVFQPVTDANEYPGASQAVFRGSNVRSVVPSRELQGRFIEEELAFGPGMRDVSLYLPPSTASTIPAIYMSNGQIAYAFAPVLDALIASEQIRPVALVGFHRGEGGLITQEYAGGDAEAFRRHMSWVVNEVVPSLRARYGLSHEANNSTIFGFSTGAEFAGAAALAHPEAFGHAWLLSVASSKPIGTASAASKVSFKLAAGTLEPNFLDSTQAYANQISGDVEFSTFVGGHDLAAWLVQFEQWLVETYPGPKATRS